jgi:hypothetical protein
MKTTRVRFSIAVAALAAFSAITPNASAALITYTQGMSGFTYNSDTISPAFNSALGSGYTHLSFASASNTNGASYSADVTFSTKVGTFGGSNTSQVNAGGEIGPYGPSWDGILNIDFNGSWVSTVGFGLVEFDSPVEFIRVYDTTNNLLATFNHQLGTQFSLFGIEATAGEQIGRLELDGNFFAIQDIEYSDTNRSQGVPDTSATFALLAMGLGLMAAMRRGLRVQR